MTVTFVCVVLPPASVLATVMVLPETEATVPLTPGLSAGPTDDGAGDVPGEPAAGGVSGGHLPPTAGLITTDCAVIAPPAGAACGAGRTSTQLPVVTSVS